MTNGCEPSTPAVRTFSSPCAAQQLDRGVGARAHVGEVLRVGADARDAHERFELGAGLVDHIVDGGDRRVALSVISRFVSLRRLGRSSCPER